MTDVLAQYLHGGTEENDEPKFGSAPRFEPCTSRIHRCSVVPMLRCLVQFSRYGDQVTGGAVRCSNPGWGKRFFFSPKVKTGSGANPASLNGHRFPFWLLSERKRDVDHQPLSSAKVKNDWSCTYFCITPIGLRLLSMDRNNSTFLPYHIQGGVTPTYPFILFYFFFLSIYISCRFAFLLTYLLYSGCAYFGSPPDHRLP